MEQPTSQRPTPMLAAIVMEVAAQMGATVVLDPIWKYAGQITFASGKRAYFRGSSLDINPHGASEIAKDKDYSALFMRQMGFPVVDGRTFFSDEWAEAIGSDQTMDAAIVAAQETGYPLIIKPNSASQGRGVFAIDSEAELRSALIECFTLDRVVLLQPLIRGRDYRVVVLGDEVISAYERVPLNVCGDGSSTIEELLNAKAVTLQRERGRACKVPFGDIRMTARLGRDGYKFTSVPRDGEIVYLLDHANLSSGGDAIDVTGAVSRAIEKLCVTVTAAMGLRLCGVDLILEGDVATAASAHILEVNSSPGLDNYAAIGSEQHTRVINLYAKIFNYIERAN